MKDCIYNFYLKLRFKVLGLLNMIPDPKEPPIPQDYFVYHEYSDDFVCLNEGYCRMGLPWYDIHDQIPPDAQFQWVSDCVYPGYEGLTIETRRPKPNSKYFQCGCLSSIKTYKFLILSAYVRQPAAKGVWGGIPWTFGGESIEASWENCGQEKNAMHATVHKWWGDHEMTFNNVISARNFYPTENTYVYTTMILPDRVDFFINGLLVRRCTEWISRGDMRIIMNTAVGSYCPKKIDLDILPDKASVKWVRVYRVEESDNDKNYKMTRTAPAHGCVIKLNNKWQ